MNGGKVFDLSFAQIVNPSILGLTFGSAIPAAIMALLADWLLNLVQRLFNTNVKGKIIKTALIILLILASTLALYKYLFTKEISTVGIRSGFESEFLVRPDGLPGLLNHYGFKLDHSPTHLDASLMYQACRDKSIDLICGYGTDGRIDAFNLIILEDDKKFFPPYYAAPLIREQTVHEYPHLRETLIELGAESSNLDQFMEEALIIEENSNQILDFTKEVKNLPETDKIKIIESLWSIIYSNNEADIYETNLMRRLAGLLYVDSLTMGDIKDRIKKKL